MKVLVLLVLGACGSKVPPGWDESTSAASAGCLWLKGWDESASAGCLWLKGWDESASAGCLWLKGSGFQCLDWLAG